VLADPTLIPALVEEGLRHSSPVMGSFRSTAADAQVGDVTIPAGSIVAIMWGAANHDPEVFNDPEAFRLDRPNPTDHVALGHGVHYCLGAMLAKAEATTAFEQLFARLPHLRVPPDVVPDYGYNLMVRGLSSLPLEFDAP
jgi:cytochrome P450